MTALNFPNSPAPGEVYSKYKWDSEKWVPGHTFVAFSPASITGLKGWWDASVPASMSLTGSRILSVADQSGNGNTITATSVDGPFYYATGFNTSYPYMSFSSAGRFGLVKTPFAMGTGNTLTAWYVGNFSDGGAIGASSNRVMAYVGGLHDYTAGSFCLNTTGFSTSTMNFTRSPGQVTYTGTQGLHRVIVTLASDGTGTMYIDGVAVGTAAMSGNWLDAGSMGIGISPTDACWWGGPIAEAGIANGFSDSTVVAQLDTYLKNKWGLNPTTNFLARTSGLDATHTAAYTALIDGLQADGIWSKLDMLHIYATNSSANALLNLVSTSYDGTLYGGPTTPVFTADRGFTGGFNRYVNTNFNPTAASSPKYVQDSAHVSAWNLTNISSGEGIIGYAAGGGESNIYPSLGGTNYFRINSGGLSGVAASSPTTGHYLANRSTSSAVQGYRNGSNALTNNAATSSAVQNMFIEVLGVNGGGTSDYQAAMSSIGASLNSTEALAFYNRLRTYMTAVGVP